MISCVPTWQLVHCIIANASTTNTTRPSYSPLCYLLPFPTNHNLGFIHIHTLCLFPHFCFFSLTASATSSFRHHVSLCLHGPFDNPHVICAVSIIIFFIFCQCSFTLRYFHSASTILSLTMLWYFCTSFLPWASIHAFLVQTSYAICLLY